MTSKSIDFAAPILTIEGETYLFPQEGRAPVSVTLRLLCVGALTETLTEVGAGGQPVPERLSPEESIRNTLLAQRIYQSDALSLTAEEVVLLKTRVHKRWPNPWLMTQAYRLLDPAALEPASK